MRRLRRRGQPAQKAIRSGGTSASSLEACVVSYPVVAPSSGLLIRLGGGRRLVAIRLRRGIAGRRARFGRNGGKTGRARGALGRSHCRRDHGGRSRLGRRGDDGYGSRHERGGAFVPRGLRVTAGFSTGVASVGVGSAGATGAGSTVVGAGSGVTAAVRGQRNRSDRYGRWWYRSADSRRLRGRPRRWDLARVDRGIGGRRRRRSRDGRSRDGGRRDHDGNDGHRRLRRGHDGCRDGARSAAASRPASAEWRPSCWGRPSETSWPGRALPPPWPRPAPVPWSFPAPWPAPGLGQFGALAGPGALAAAVTGVSAALAASQ